MLYALEVVGSCNICYDRFGSPENPLVPCNGDGCDIIVHQACYGIAVLPFGPWYCNTCETKERAPFVQCELCPSKDGAFKRTESKRWVHVICSLYIPEARFGNPELMEPVILSHIPRMRFQQKCYICTNRGRHFSAAIGACMECKKKGCKRQFHATCAQRLGLLFEEPQTRMPLPEKIPGMPKTKEMVGGCCVCSDEHGWTENPLVYCDGDGCNVAVHQACYGIVTVPTGPWYCSKCKSTERTVRVKCELCPSKDGALKRTDSNGWAHVVCALYIPEVRFGNVATMEPIILSLIPQERFNKNCYICTEQGRGSKATTGACMQCNKAGCKQQFHVTCAQTLGLLCEETGNYMDNVKYCGYCQHHNAKLKKGSNVKAIPPYKPIVSGEHESSPEKETSSGKKKSYLAVKNIGAEKKSHSPSPDLGSVLSMDVKDDDEKSSSSGVTLKFGSTSSHSADTGLKTETKNKFTTSNFTETVVTQSEPVFASDKVDSSDSKNKKRKEGDVVGTTTTGATPNQPLMSSTPTIKTVSVSLSQLKTTIASTASKSSISVSGLGKSLGASLPPAPKSNLAVYGTGTKITITSREDPKKYKIEGSESSAPPAVDVSEGYPGKRPRSSSQEKSRKNKRSQNRRPGDAPARDELDSPPGSPEVLKNRKKHAMKEEKDVKPVSAPHMLGNQLNPASSMPHLQDSLHQEVEAHSIYSQDSQPSNLVAPPIPRKFRQTSSQNDRTTLSAANSLLSLGNPSSNQAPTPAAAAASQPQGLESLLERQWEQGHQFLMEQAQYFDIGSLLNCLHSLKRDNTQLEEQVQQLTQRRDHLLAVNARFNMQPTQNAPTTQAEPEPRMNGGDPSTYHQSPQLHTSTSQPIRTSSLAFAAAQRRPVVSQFQQSPQMNTNIQANSMIKREDPHM